MEIVYNLEKEHEELTTEQLEQNLHKIGINEYSKEDFESLVTKMCDINGKMTNISRYAKGHLFDMYGERTSLEKQIAIKLGGLNE